MWPILKFSLKSIALIVLLAAFGFAAVAASHRSRILEQKLQDLRDSHGYVTVDSSGDRWEAVTVGKWTSDVHDVFLLRVRNFDRYELTIHFYDGVTFKYSSAIHQFVANETAIRLIPHRNVVYVHDATLPIDNYTNLKIAATPSTYSINYGRDTDVVSDHPIRAFALLTSPSKQPHFGHANQLLFKDRARIEETCKKYEMKCVWFTINER